MSFSPFKTLQMGLLIGMLALSLSAASCSKSKKEPNVGYDSTHSGSEGSSGDIQQSDIGGDGKTVGVRSGTGSSAGMETVYFDYDSSTLSSDARSTIQKNATFLKSNKSAVTIEGHCDDRGSTEYNLALGERRAHSVRDYMVNLGVAKNRLKTVSYGEERPAVRGSGEEAWAKNRRAEFVAN